MATEERNFPLACLKNTIDRPWAIYCIQQNKWIIFANLILHVLLDFANPT
ncbi:hypothetical protein HMPREF1705_04593 [Acetomicrobium hydrogeniformans ATCC BAA-1850]|uniref:Uncharacterized protein n=1 Tax=Acetomicrobium hydrogeniformans ATCC BAA-1850 TaxID=592015 RepID=A0A0T5XAE4_9BACT|nr:hypothetical protein HMPREF1705_04593 [Acetomicrobium hydrogeniformans ATCC BAA-1850]